MADEHNDQPTPTTDDAPALTPDITVADAEIAAVVAEVAAVGANWATIRGVLLTHTHTDHWKDATLGYLKRLKI